MSLGESRLCVLAGAIAFAVMGGVGVPVQVTETLLDGNAADDFDARISGNNIVFSTFRNGNLDIFRSIEPGLNVPLAAGPGNQEDADIDGVQVVYVDDTAGNDNIFYIADLTVGVSQVIVGNAANDNAPAISGDNVVFFRNADLFRFDLQLDAEFPFVVGPDAHLSPAIDQLLVAWLSLEAANQDVFASDIGGLQFPVEVGPAQSKEPSVSGDLIAYIADDDVFVFDRSNSQTSQLTNDAFIQTVAFVEGQNVLWGDNSTGNLDIFLHHLPTGETFQLTTDPFDQILTDVSGNVAVFHDDRAGNLNVWRLDFVINHAPVASPTATPSSGAAPLLVQFAANAADADGDPLTTTWDFGDPGSPDNTSTLADPGHVYETPGSFLVFLTVSDSLLEASASLLVAVSAGPIEVEIDIKPGSFPNAINLGSNGVVPVAILSSPTFDATDVDADTVQLSGAGVAVRGRGNRLMAHLEDVNGDGLLDLVLQVETQNFDPAEFQGGFAILTGTTFGGQEFEGVDEIILVP